MSKDLIAAIHRMQHIFLSRVFSLSSHNHRFHVKMLSLVTASFLFAGIAATGESTRTQTFELNEGWNAIWLAVEPADPDPAAVFTNSPVDIVAAYDGVFSTRQFTTDASANMLSQLGWKVWYAPDRADAFLTELGAVHGQRGYLVFSKEANTLEIPGGVEMPEVLWQPGAFNLVGFCLDSLAPPSFQQFFSVSDAHASFSIYRMINGTWRKVLEPENEAMRSGEAFWIFCDGSSDYQGPLRVESEGGAGVLLTDVGDEITLRNETDYPLSPEISHVVAGGSGVPMAVVIDVVDDAIGGIKPLPIPMVETEWSTLLPVMEAGEAFKVPLALQPEKMTETEAWSLLCVKTDIGTETWLPVKGTLEDLR